MNKKELSERDICTKFMQRSIGEEIQHDRPLARGACRFDAAVRRVLRQMQHLGAVREQRRTALTKIRTPGVELAERQIF